MPGGDRTGPYGEGPMTGRRMGYCAGSTNPGWTDMNLYRGKGMGRGYHGNFYRGRGYGRGFGYGPGNFFPAYYPDESEKTIIENQIRNLKDQLSFWEDKLSKTEEK